MASEKHGFLSNLNNLSLTAETAFQPGRGSEAKQKADVPSAEPPVQTDVLSCSLARREEKATNASCLSNEESFPRFQQKQDASLIALSSSSYCRATGSTAEENQATIAQICLEARKLPDEPSVCRRESLKRIECVPIRSRSDGSFVNKNGHRPAGRVLPGSSSSKEMNSLSAIPVGVWSDSRTDSCSSITCSQMRDRIDDPNGNNAPWVQTSSTRQTSCSETAVTAFPEASATASSSLNLLTKMSRATSDKQADGASLAPTKTAPKTSTVQPSGYDAPFIEPLEAKHKCPKCELALRDPVQTDCGHRFCKNCIQPILKSSKPARCPVDEVPLENVYPDNFCKREVLGLPVVCHNHESGCEWTGTLKGLLEEHYTDCPFALVACDNKWLGCKLEVRISELAEHVAKDCEYRETKCPLCLAVLPFCQIKVHMDEVCPEAEIDCPNACGAKQRRLEVPDHIEKVCPEAIKVCPFADAGCSFKGKAGALEEHVSESTNHHLQLVQNQSSQRGDDLKEALATATAKEEEVTAIQNDIEQLQAKYSQLDERVKIQDRVLGSLVGLVERMAKVERSVAERPAGKNPANDEPMASLRRNFTDLSLRVTRVEEKANGAKKTCEALQAQAAMADHQLVTLNQVLTRTDRIMADFDLRLLSQETTSYSGTLVWKIPDYARHFIDAQIGKKTSLYSPPFFTGRHGYKACARVYLNGDGAGKSTHISIFFVVMRGEFDALLPWPFHHKVTLTLIDQSPAKQHISDTFQPDAHSSSFQRPTTDMNIASGCPRFAPLDKMKSTPGYIKDDTVFIRVSIDSSGLHKARE